MFKKIRRGTRGGQGIKEKQNNPIYTDKRTNQQFTLFWKENVINLNQSQDFIDGIVISHPRSE